MEEVAALLDAQTRLREALLQASARGSLAELEDCFAEVTLQNSGSGGGLATVPLDEQGQSALHLVAARRDSQAASCCTRLLALRADCSGRDSKGRTPLFQAAGEGLEECVTLLLQARCDPQGLDSAGESALFGAARSGRDDTGAALLAAGARSDHRAPAAAGGQTAREGGVQQPR